MRTHFLQGPTYDAEPELGALLDDLAPDVLMGVDFIAALLLKRAAPRKPLLFYTSGCTQLKFLIIQGRVSDYVSLREQISRTPVGPFGHPCGEEREAVELADLIVTHADIILDLLRFFFPDQRQKIHPDVLWKHEWIAGEAERYQHLARPFHEREIDVLFMASSWGRVEKNYPMVKEIIAELRELNIHVAGDVESQEGSAEYYGLVPEREQVFELLGNARVFVSPSHFDPAPGVLFQAAGMGANVVATPNSPWVSHRLWR